MFFFVLGICWPVLAVAILLCGRHFAFLSIHLERWFLESNILLDNLHLWDIIY